MTYYLQPLETIGENFETNLPAQVTAWLEAQKSSQEDMDVMAGDVSQWLKSEQAQDMVRGIDTANETIRLVMSPNDSVPIAYEGEGQLYEVGRLQIVESPSRESESSYVLAFRQTDMAAPGSYIPVAIGQEITLTIQKGAEYGYAEQVVFGEIADIIADPEGGAPSVVLDLKYPQVSNRVAMEPVNFDAALF